MSAPEMPSRVVPSTAPAPAPSAAASHRRSRLFLPAFVVGWAIIWYGATRALGDARDAHPFALLVHIVSFDLAHDLVIVPVVIGVGWALGRLLPAVARGPVRAAVALSVIVFVFSYPLIRRWGRRPTNSSTLPLPYARNVSIVIGAIWLVALATVLLRHRRATRSA
jgi:hypothetical protein